MPHLGEFTKKTHAGLTAQADLHTPKSHGALHENGGAQEISVAGLSGALADAQTPKAHAASHKDGAADEIDLSGLSGQQILVPYNGKIADITEADTGKHTLNLATALPETRTIIAVLINAARISGSGEFRVYPNEGSASQRVMYDYELPPALVVIASGTNRLQYAQTTAKDDWDLYCYGYVVTA